MKILTTVAQLRTACDEARGSGLTIGLVPTMGYLHEGHRSLMRAARRADRFVVVTIFVNPLQFGPQEDLASYPRDLERDTAIAEAEGVSVLFVPSVGEMYPEPPRTTVHVAGLTEGMCGAARPTHFDGVTTVVAKLFSITGRCRAYFGRKDAQQLAVVTRMALDLDLPVDVVGCPLVRESDGVAMSSRNAYLGDADRRAARVLSASLRSAARDIEAGTRDAPTLRAGIAARIDAEPRVGLEYVEIRRADDLEPVDTLTGPTLIAVAAQVGRARLIDNITVTFTPDGRPEIDLGISAAKIESESTCAAG